MIEDENGENVINPDSLKIMKAYAESAIKDAAAGEKFRIFRHGYYIADEIVNTGKGKVFNKIVNLKSSWEK